ncbi:MAG: hypothetical protein LiPW16_490 [Microgenomates group bacterium LiPW_16]|nr:MAG: hypothetical protein LiPW16_490 [Microgenomates group bacterium LiPW_16]
MRETLPLHHNKEKLGPSHPTAIFIDGPYLSKAADFIGLRKNNQDFDFEKMLKFLLGPGKLITARYYTGLKFSPQVQPFFNKLEEFGYVIIQSTENPVTGKVAPVDHQLLSDLCLLKDSYEIANVVSGDGDFAYPIEKLTRDFGKRINIIAARHNMSTRLLALAQTYPLTVRILLLDKHSPQFVMRKVFR